MMDTVTEYKDEIPPLSRDDAGAIRNRHIKTCLGRLKR